MNTTFERPEAMPQRLTSLKWRTVLVLSPCFIEEVIVSSFEENKGFLLFPSPCFRIEEVLVSPLTFAGVGNTVIVVFVYKRFKQANKLGQTFFIMKGKHLTGIPEVIWR